MNALTVGYLGPSSGHRRGVGMACCAIGTWGCLLLGERGGFCGWDSDTDRVLQCFGRRRRNMSARRELHHWHPTPIPEPTLNSHVPRPRSDRCGKRDRKEEGGGSGFQSLGGPWDEENPRVGRGADSSAAKRRPRPGVSAGAETGDCVSPSGTHLQTFGRRGIEQASSRFT